MIILDLLMKKKILSLHVLEIKENEMKKKKKLLERVIAFRKLILNFTLNHKVIKKFKKKCI